MLKTGIDAGLTARGVAGFFGELVDGERGRIGFFGLGDEALSEYVEHAVDAAAVRIVGRDQAQVQGVQQSDCGVHTHHAKAEHGQPVGRHLTPGAPPVFAAQGQPQPHAAADKQQVNQQIAPQHDRTKAQGQPQRLERVGHGVYSRRTRGSTRV